MTTDDSKAALTEALRTIVETPEFGERFGGALLIDAESVEELAAAILGERAVFWPTGLEEYRELIHQYQAEITRYRTALTSITNMADRDARGSAIEIARAALAGPKLPPMTARPRWNSQRSSAAWTAIMTLEPGRWPPPS